MNPKSLLDQVTDNILINLSYKEKKDLIDGKGNLGINLSDFPRMRNKLVYPSNVYCLLSDKIERIYNNKQNAIVFAKNNGLNIRKLKVDEKSHYYYCILLPSGGIGISSGVDVRNNESYSFVSSYVEEDKLYVKHNNVNKCYNYVYQVEDIMDNHHYKAF